MIRTAFLLAFGIWLAPSLIPAQVARPQLIDQTAANRHGLARSWFAYVNIGGGRSPIVDIQFDAGTLFVQTGIATTHAMDAETGRTLWVADVGSPSHPSQRLGLSESRVAVVNGTTLYVLDRATGQVQFTNSLRGVPSTGAALSAEAVFVPTMAAQLETYSIVEDDHRNLANLRLEGRNLPQPAVSHLGAAIGSDRGDFGLAALSGMSMLFSTPTNFGFVASPAAWGPRVYAGNAGGLLYLFDDVGGREKWSFAAGSPITQSPVPFADAVYVLCEDLRLFRVSAETGREEWMAQNIRSFLATSPTKVYAIDRFGRLAVLSAKTGALIDRVSIPLFAFPITNNDSDQIILATDTGLIQALHEIELTKRISYLPPPPEPPKTEPTAAEADKAKAAEAAAPTEKPAVEDQPAPRPMPPAENPFGPPTTKPAEEENPFGGM
ncbi:MAG: PQQ-binding-like beta-propeller repeat protein [Pirellulales bacterium]